MTGYVRKFGSNTTISFNQILQYSLYCCKNNKSE